MRKLIKLALLLIVMIVSVTLIIHAHISHSTRSLHFQSIDDIPAKRTALVLGTSKYVARGQKNLYYTYRINAAVSLYKAGKVKYILVSGDNGTMSYNEPVTIKQDLMSRGVPEEAIYLDYAGFRTHDSIIRCKEIFDQQDIIIVSQRFHNERALYLAKHFGLNAVALNAQDVTAKYGIKTQIRERLARVKMVIDLVLDKEPKYLGEKIPIG